MDPSEHCKGSSRAEGYGKELVVSSQITLIPKVQGQELSRPLLTGLQHLFPSGGTGGATNTHLLICFARHQVICDSHIQHLRVTNMIGYTERRRCEQVKQWLTGIESTA